LLSTYPQAATAAAAVAVWTTARYRNILRRLREYCVTQYRDTTVEMGGAEKNRDEYDTIRYSCFTCAQKPTEAGVTCHTEPKM